ncbi:MAG TPA: M56 family metallopeptidase [Vicinamibacterales bacterium]|jgi:beta-lactamase regulating signal transducer with metallopeptidase domain
MSLFALDIIVRASALLAVAALADLVLRRSAPAAARHLLWTVSTGALLALPIASYVLPDWTVPIPIARPLVNIAPSGAATSNVVVTPGVAFRALPAPCTEDGRRCESDTTPAGASALPRAPRLSQDGAIAALYAVYATGVVLLLVRLVLEPFALRRLTRASREVTDASWRRLRDDAAAQLGVSRAVRLVRSKRDVVPLTFGTIAPTIVLPASADGWTTDRRRAVLLHELAHVARHDCLVQRIAACASALYWPHPGVWWAAKRMRAEQELACDDRVLASGASAREYAGHLLDIAHTFRAAPAPASALGMARARQLERRLLAILDEARNRAALGRGRGSVLVAVAIAVFLPMAAVRAAFVPTDSVPQAKSSTSGAQEFTGTWEAHLTSDPARVQLSVRSGHSTHGRTMALADLERLAGTTLASASTVHFPIRREAGTFTIDGTCRNSACAGTFVFEPSATFGVELEKRGIGRPTPQDQFHLAVSDIGIAYLDTLAAAGYAKPDLPTLVRAAQHGVGDGYVKDMAALGYRLGTVDALIRLRDHGVDPEYVRGMAASGLAKLSADDLVRARDHGVDPDYVHGLAALGFSGLGLDALVGARDHGIDPEYIRGMQGLGHKLTIDGYTRTRDHGVDPEYVRGLASLGYQGLTDDALVGARDHGVDPEYVRDMAALGYKGVPLDALIRMRDHGVDPEYVRRLQQRGVTNLSVDEIIRRRDRGDDR